MEDPHSGQAAGRSWPAYIFQVLALAVGYYAFGLIGRLVSISDAQITAFWPPSGLALAALMLGGPRLWPGVFLGHVVGNTLSAGSGSLDQKILMAVLIALGSTPQALVGMWVGRRWTGSGKDQIYTLMTTPGGVLWFLGPVALISTLISPTNGVSMLVMTGSLPAALWDSVWLTWYLGDLVGVLVLTPLILAWCDRRWIFPPRHGVIEAAALTVLTGAVLYFTLLQTQMVTVHLFLPLLAWAAWRFGTRGATLALLAASVVTALSVITNRGPFTGAGLSANTSMLLGQLFIANCVGAALVLAAASSRRLRLEWELREANAELEKRVEDRTAELSLKNTELLRTIDELEQARERMMFQSRMAGLGSVASGVAHEIRNPLNFILNFSELSSELSEELRDGVIAATKTKSYDVAEISELADDLRTNLIRIVEHSKRADRIVSSMLEHSREGGGDFCETQLGRLITDHARIAVQNTTATCPVQPITLEVVVEDGADTALVCPKSLGRAILNIADNSCQAVHEFHYGANGPQQPHPRLRFEVARESEFTVITLTDNGPGIPADVLPRVLEPFFTTKPPGSGTGLGLSIAYAIVHDEHAGTVEVTNAPGGGARVRICIPTAGKPGGRTPLFQEEVEEQDG
jgi:two-component system NtrC family sensor kinase